MSTSTMNAVAAVEESAAAGPVGASGPPSQGSGPLRIGLIGSGKMGLHHLKAISAVAGATVVGIADPAANVEELRPLLPPDTIVVASAAELFERTKVDVVHIVTPPSSHMELAAQAIAAGCHVYVEKPFTPTAAEAARVFALAAERGVQVCAGHQVLFEAPARALLASLDHIGRVVHLESYFSFRMVRRNITAVEQVKDILPHAVYPVVEQLRTGTGQHEDPIEVCGVSVDATGDAYAMLRLGGVTAVVLVTINGRPVEQFQTVSGTNGSLRADYIGGSLTRLTGPGTGPGALLTPYRRAWQTAAGTTRGIWRLVMRRGASYPGLVALIGAFYDSVRQNGLAPLTPGSILDTVRICETIGEALDVAARQADRAARARLVDAEAARPPLQPNLPAVLVTGGTGSLGCRVADELRQAGFPVRVVARRQPPASTRIAGVEYVVGDLSCTLDPLVMRGIGVVLHCAAETAGGKAEQQKNSIDATRNVMTSAAAAGVRRVLHVSSIAVLESSRAVGRPIDETVAVDAAALARGPYVWGKAESELLALRLGAELGLEVKVVRPGPLVDYAAFHPPGRLGREVGPVFVAMGPKRGPLSVCDVSTAARVLRSYAEDFDAAPPVLNLVEAPPPLRCELLARFLSNRRDLRVVWIPSVVLRGLSGPLKLLQRIALGAKQPVDIAAAFASEKYQTDLAARVIERAGATRTVALR